jgi:hypothetical protein
LISAVAILALAWGCSAQDGQRNGATGSGGADGQLEAGLSDHVSDSNSMAQAGEGPVHLNPLCGGADSRCTPDDLMACASYRPPVTPAAGGGATGANASSGGGANASSGGGANAANKGEAGAGGANGSGAEAGSGGGGDVLFPTMYGCQVQRVADQMGSVISQCALAGTGAANAPCLTSSDCQAGFGCVGDESSGLCQRYCCQDADACEHDTYCAERPMRDAIVNGQAQGSGDTSRAPMIPVCVPAVNCDLAEPHPCMGKQCACTGDTACLVVRSDGTTTCAVPGSGKAGDACPCAWGYLCSAATTRCLQLCYTRDAGACGKGKCQAASELPDGWGLCIDG